LSLARKFFDERYKNGVAINPNAAKIENKIETGEVTIVEYISGSKICDIYKLYLGRWPKERFTIIGDMSRYDVFLERLSELLGHEITAEHVKRKMSYGLDISDEEEAEIRDFLAEGFKWYRSFIDGI
jgi:hypothetical protein